MNLGLLRALAAEAIGTFALVFAGCGAIMVDAKTHQLGHIGVAISFGLVIMFGIYAVGHISGAHFNAAVTFAFALTRHFPWPRAAAYWGAQFVGALCAAALLRASLGKIAHVGATLPSGSQRQAFLWEAVMSAFLMFVILAVATENAALRAELQRLRARYEGRVEAPPSTKYATPEPKNSSLSLIHASASPIAAGHQMRR